MLPSRAIIINSNIDNIADSATKRVHRNRRTVLKTIGGIAIVGGTLPGLASANNEELCWEGQGTDAIDGVADGAWGKFVLTGGQSDIESAVLKNEITGETADGEVRGGGRGAVHFELSGEFQPGEVCLKSYDGDLGRNAQIVLSEYIVVGYQIDLIWGDPIERFDPPSGTYNAQNRLLQAYWSGTGLEDFHFGQNDDKYRDCDAAITTNIGVDDWTATACIDPGSCEVADFTLVSYSAPGDSWDAGEAPQQRMYDHDPSGDEEGCFSVAVPPVADS